MITFEKDYFWLPWYVQIDNYAQFSIDGLAFCLSFMDSSLLLNKTNVWANTVIYNRPLLKKSVTVVTDFFKSGRLAVIA